MIGQIPKFREGRPLPDGYNETPNPYKNPAPSDINLRLLFKYAREKGKDPMEMTYEEVEQFMIKRQSKEEPFSL